jgi:putative transposase
MDWASRKVLASTVAITLEVCHVVALSHEAFTRHGQPEVVNTDQGSQFTAQAFVHAVKAGVSSQHGWARSLEG